MSQRVFALPNLKRLSKAGYNSIPHRNRVVGIGIRIKQDGKFVATQAGDEVTIAQVSHEATAYRFQQCVARCMEEAMRRAGLPE
jgi:hypothetical protein